MLVMPAEGAQPSRRVNVLERLPPMAGFEVSTYGRIWVSTEVARTSHHKDDHAICPSAYAEYLLYVKYNNVPRRLANDPGRSSKVVSG